MLLINSLRPRLDKRPFADNIFKCIFLNENEWILHRISLKFVPKVRINNIPTLVQIMVWRQPGDKPLSEPMMVSLLRHICVTQPQWVNDNLLQPLTKILSKWHFDFTWFRIMTEISPNLLSMILTLFMTYMQILWTWWRHQMETFSA